ncbi:hypothetical protein MMC13_002836 [Lambiella insularis]|nr:hypothetical protein [Lambiella insularis]
MRLDTRARKQRQMDQTTPRPSVSIPSPKATPQPGSNSQDQEQQHDARDLLVADGVRDAVALLRPHVEEEGAVDGAVAAAQGGGPVPEDAAADGEDDGGDAEGPDEEVAAEVPGGVEGAAAVEEQGEGEGAGVVEEGEGGGEWVAEGKSVGERTTYGSDGQAVSPVAVAGRVDEVLVGACDGHAEEHEGDEGEEGRDDAQDRFGVPSRVSFVQSPAVLDRQGAFHAVHNERKHGNTMRAVANAAAISKERRRDRSENGNPDSKNPIEENQEATCISSLTTSSSSKPTHQPPHPEIRALLYPSWHSPLDGTSDDSQCATPSGYDALAANQRATTLGREEQNAQAAGRANLGLRIEPEVLIRREGRVEVAIPAGQLYSSSAVLDA